MSEAARRSSVVGFGSAFPAWSMEQGRAAAHASARSADTPRRRAVVERLYRRSGVARRPVSVRELAEGGGGDGVGGEVDDGSGGDGVSDRPLFALAEAGDPLGPTTAARLAHYLPAATAMGEAAAGEALRAAGVATERVTHLVTASCTGFTAPNVDVALIDALGLPRGVQRTHVGYMGCHAAMNALRVADGFVGADAGSVVLVVAVEVCSIHLAYGWDPQAIVSNALFGDGSAAVVVASEAGIDRPATWRLVDRETMVWPGTRDAMTWRITDHGFRMTLSSGVPGRIEASLEPVLARLLARHGLGIDAVDHWAVHPGGPQVLAATRRALGLSETALGVSHDVLREMGNLSSPTVLIILDRLAGRSTPGQRCVALAFGPGLTVEAALVERGVG
jgi:predicted naringenin-chalcone synthase